VRFLERRPGRAAGEERVVVAGPDGKRAAFGLWFSGRESAGVRPWADLVVEDLAVIPDVVEALGPGGSLMVAYEGDETERALRRKVPSAATPVGLAMLKAGCRWFKDWYYPEGGREGGTKLQATVPLDDVRRIAAEQRLVQELEEFDARAGIRDADRDRAREALGFVAPRN
jgi:hypothetical protein